MHHATKGTDHIGARKRPRLLSLFTAVAMACGVLFVFAGPASAVSSLGPGRQLHAGQRITAGGYWLVMQGDGNLVEYNSAGKQQWNTHTAGQPGNYLVMQGDGNLVVYSSGGSWRWQSGTNGYSGARLAIQTDGNIVVYSARDLPLWAKSWTQTANGAQAYAKVAFFQHGWSVANQFSYLLTLWNMESGWRWNVCHGNITYPNCPYTTVDYGIPQSRPGSKMAASGPDWATNGLTQVAWGLSYIHGRYGTPEKALAHELAVGWY
jgi:hypothetical protein